MLHKSIIFDGRNLNLSELARKSGLRRAHLHHIFNFRRTPSLLYAIKLSRAMGMSLDEFVVALSRRRVGLEEKDDETANHAAWSCEGAARAQLNGYKRIQLWDEARGERAGALQDSQDTVISMAWSPDGKMLAAVSRDKTIRLWEAATGNLIRMLQGHQSLVSTVTWSPEGRTLASAGLDGSILLWDVASGNLVRTLRNSQLLAVPGEGERGSGVIANRDCTKPLCGGGKT